MIGQTVGHYRILEKLGEGGMGVVYKAQDVQLDRTVALKFLPHHLTANEAEKARFLQEAKAASALNHPNVCTIYGIGEYQGEQYIEMEYVEGVTLRETIPVEKLSEALGYAIQIADALQEAHAKGIVHRDIKAENIMVNAKNQIKVMDFGLAKLKGSLKLTRTSSTVGTLAYMAPEQIQGEEVDHRGDIFSFGVVLFEMLTGKLPFRGEHEAALMYSIVNEEPESALHYRQELPPELLHVLGRALEKDPSDRYQSAQDMIIDLRRLQKQSTKVTRTSLASMPLPPKEKLQPAPPKRPISPRLLALAGLVVVVGIAVALMKVLRPASPAEPFRSIKISRLTSSGKASNAAISPDGKYVVHVVAEGARRSLWVRQVATTSNVMILPPADRGFRGLTFSPDGNFVYYAAVDEQNLSGALFEIPVLGGTPRKILSEISSAAAFSPDGKQIAFIRQYHEVGEEALMVANADGSAERKLAGRKGDDFFISYEGVTPSWSPDGSLIAITAASNTGGQHINLVAYSVSDGTVKLLSPENWERLGRVCWLPGGSGVVAVGRRGTSTASQLYSVAYPGGAVRSITNDLNDYLSSSLGVTSDEGSLVATVVDIRSNVWVVKRSAGGWDSQQAVQLTSGSASQDGWAGLAWTPEHAIVYTSISAGALNLWSIEKDGSNQRQLTVGTHRSFDPEVSPDGKSIVFGSDRDTTPQLWRMDADGGNVTKLSRSEDYMGKITPDSKWVVYSGWATGKTLLYRLPLAGGDTVNISQNPASAPRLSPDGKRIVCGYYDEPHRKWGMALLAYGDGSLQRFFMLPPSSGDRSHNWAPDGASITYIDTRDGVSNIWALPAEGGEPRQLTHFTSGLIFSYAWSRDGEYLALARGDMTSDVVLITENK